MEEAIAGTKARTGLEETSSSKYPCAELFSVEDPFYGELPTTHLSTIITFACKPSG